jgi:RHS repeat-associated protein
MGGDRIEPPKLRAEFSLLPSDAEISAARVFRHPARPAGGRRGLLENRRAAELMRRYEGAGAGGREENAGMLRAFAAQNPDSPWAPSALLEAGMNARGHGRFGRAREDLRGAWDRSKAEADPEGRLVAEQALVELITLTRRLGQREALRALVEEAGGMDLGGAARVAVERAQSQLAYLEHQAEQNILCGILAVNAACRGARSFGELIGDVDDPGEGARLVREGMSLSELARRANGNRAHLRMARRLGDAPIPVPAVVHWSFEHYSAIREAKDGLYRVQDPYLGSDCWVTGAALAEEGSGYFLVPDRELGPGWVAVGEEEGRGVRGRHCTHDREDQGCQDKGGGQTNPCGMPGYTFRLLDAGLVLEDTPIGYRPPRGPAIKFTVTYDGRNSFMPAVKPHGNFGAQWTHGWTSYLAVGPGAEPLQVTLFDGGGAYFDFSLDTQAGTYSSPFARTWALARVGTNHFEVTLADGSRRVYARPNAAAATAIYLSAIVDPAGNAATLEYDSRMRLVRVRDALGQATRIEYVSRDSFLIGKIRDPFGRRAKFEYDSRGRLVTITDPADIVSRFRYGAGDSIESMETPYGTTRFSQGAKPGMWGLDRWVEAGLPNGDRERVEATDQAPGVPERDPAPPARYVTVGGEGVGLSFNNSYLHYRNTYHWDRKAMHEAPGDYSAARVYHWRSLQNSTYSVLESHREPGGSRVWLDYAGPGIELQPVRRYRVVEAPGGGAATAVEQFGYDAAFGNLVRRVDPAGRETRYQYAANGIDLLCVRQRTASGLEPVASYGDYTASHMPRVYTNAAGGVYRFTYNGFGQPSSVTDPLGGVTTNIYDALGFLAAIDGPLPGDSDTTSFSYDGFNRVRTVTGPDGYALTYDYDSLDRPTAVTYPDGTTNSFHYSRLDLAWRVDRDGRATRYFYNALRQRVAEIDPLGRLTHTLTCCGEDRVLVDPMGRVTRWKVDPAGRVTEKLYPDGKKDVYGYQPLSGRLASVTDAMGQVRRYGYAADGNLAWIRYSDAVVPTAGVDFTHDPYFDRVISMADGLGATTNTYHPPGQAGAMELASTDGPLAGASDRITYGYDPLGRRVSRNIGASGNENLVEWSHDAIGRVTNVAGLLGGFAYAYDGATERLLSVDYPSGQRTEYAYHDNLRDRRLKEIHHRDASLATLSRFAYAYDVAGRITAWTQRLDAASPPRTNAWACAHDAAGQLTGVADASPGPGEPALYAYRYDPAGNRLTERAGDAISSAGFNALNQITNLAAGGAMRFAGTLDEPAAVTVAGAPAPLDARTNFAGHAQVAPGTNLVAVAAEDVNGNRRTNTYEVVLGPGAGRAFTYDANGNTLSDGEAAYAWDAENRLARIDRAGGTTLFRYDGLGRRAGIIELSPAGATNAVRNFVWDGIEIAEERGADGSVAKRFYPQGFRAEGATPENLYYTRDHLGSVREVVAADGATARAAHAYDPWGRNTKLSGDVDADFLFTGHFYHQPSGLHLAPFRAYDPAVGRWTSRDPLPMAEVSQGINLYAYCASAAIGSLDLLGLWTSASGNHTTECVIDSEDPGSLVGAIVAGVVIVGIIAGPEVAANLRFDGPGPPRGRGASRLCQVRWRNTPLMRLDWDQNSLHLNIGPGSANIHVPIWPPGPPHR